MTALKGLIRQITARRPPFEVPARVDHRGRRGASYASIGIAADALKELDPLLPADAIRLGWSDGISRALTVVDHDQAAGRIVVDVVDHGDGALAEWLRRAEPGEQVRLSGPRCEFAVPSGVDEFILLADASAVPAVAGIIGAIPGDRTIWAVVQAAEVADRALIPAHPGLRVQVEDGDGLLRAFRELDEVGTTACAWLAGERDLVRQARRHATGALGLSRDQLQASAYWFAGRTMTDTDEEKIHRYSEAARDGADLADSGFLDRIELLE